MYTFPDLLMTMITPGETLSWVIRFQLLKFDLQVETGENALGESATTYGTYSTKLLQS